MALVAAAEFAVLSAGRRIGHWRCSEPGPRKSHPSAAASIWTLMAATSAANAAPSRMLESPAPLAEKLESFIKPFSIRLSLLGLLLLSVNKLNRKEKKKLK